MLALVIVPVLSSCLSPILFRFIFQSLPTVHMQVTNPAIDPLREGLVMSLEVNIGKRGNILEVGPENASQVSIIVLISLPFLLEFLTQVDLVS